MDIAEKEYQNLLVNEGISKELIEQPRFRENFCHIYDMLNNDGKKQVKIEAQGNKICLSSSGMAPESVMLEQSNGIFSGYREYAQYVFSMEQFSDKNYFTIREYSAEGRKYSKNKNELIGCSVNLHVYDGNVEVGNSYASGFGDWPDQIDLRAMPHQELEIGYTNNGAINPKDTDFYTNRYTDYISNVQGRGTADSGVVRKHDISIRNGKTQERTAIGMPNYEDPFSLSNGIDEMYVNDVTNHSEQIIDSRYNTIQEVKDACQEAYNKYRQNTSRGYR